MFLKREEKEKRTKPREEESEEPEGQKRLTELRKRRDEANAQARDIASKNKGQIIEFKNCLAQAREEKTKRDAENEAVKRFVSEKKALEQRIAEAKKRVEEKTGALKGLEGFEENPLEIERRIEELEWVQQTEACSAKEEKELSKKINDLRKKLPKTHAAVEAFAELRKARNELRELISVSKNLSAEIGKHAQASDGHHEKRLKLFEKADKLQESISATFSELDAKRGLADAQHQELIEAHRQNRAQEDAERSRETRQKKTFESRARRELGVKAREILEKFRNGGKLSHEEILILKEADAL